MITIIEIVIIRSVWVSQKFDNFIISKLHIWALILSILYFSQTFSFYSYLSDKLNQKKLFINYANPEQVKIKPNHPKNLVLIYLESIEDAYKNSNIFGKNLLASLDDLEGTSFKNYQQIVGTWTLASTFGTQCGIPIMLDYLNYNNLCLSDILNKHGYYNVYMQGTSLDFNNKRPFFSKHKYNEIYGREEWINKGDRSLSEWGIYDDDLFKEALIKFKELHATGRLFSLTILTGDTHEPKGYLSQYCKNKGASSITEIIECSTGLVANFVRFIKDNGYMQDTNIVIIGDHLYPRDILFNNIPKSKRYIFNRFISEKAPIKNREEIVLYDLFPTIMDFIGLKIEGGRLGIGKTGLNDN